VVKTKILLVLLLAVSIISMASVTLDWGRVYSLPGAQEIFKVSEGDKELENKKGLAFCFR
jgi:hypothetical protein